MKNKHRITRTRTAPITTPPKQICRQRIYNATHGGRAAEGAAGFSASAAAPIDMPRIIWVADSDDDDDDDDDDDACVAALLSAPDEETDTAGDDPPEEGDDAAEASAEDTAAALAAM